MRLDREWAGETTLTLRLPQQARVVPRPRGAVALARGPLLYALGIGEEWRYLRGERPHADWEVLSDKSLELRPGARSRSRSPMRCTSRSAGSARAPSRPRARRSSRGSRAIAWTGWDLAHNAAAPPPQNPARPDGPPEELTLLPYGATNLRITEFPLIAE